MIKKIPLILVLAFAFGSMSGQTVLTLDSCINLTVKNYPLAKQKADYEKISELKTNNLKANYLPTLSLNAKATYQSETFSIDIETPSGFNLNFPIPPLDQYSVYAEAKQVIWDGGITKSLKETEGLRLSSKKKRNDIELIKIEEQTENVFFAILFLNEAEKQLNVVKNDLISKRKSIASAIKNGILTPDNDDIIEAEILKLEQKISEIKESKKASIKTLSVFTCIELPDSLILIEPKFKTITSFDGTNTREELQLFDIQQQILNSNINTMDKKRMPKFYLFAQLGYGNPGLTMLKDEWGTYFIGGAMLSWNIWDKNNTKRTNEILRLNSNIIDSQKEIFNKNIIIAANSKIAEINKLESFLKTDLKITALRKNISEKAEIKLNNGTITSSEYISLLNEKNNAIIEYQIHRIKLLKAKRDYYRIINK